MNKQSIDWEKIHLTLENTQRKIKKTFSCSTKNEQKILEKRAKKLEKKVDEVNNNQSGVGIIEFLLGDEHYGIESTYATTVCSV